MHDPHANATLDTLEAAFSALVAEAAQVHGDLGAKSADLKSVADTLASLVAGHGVELDRLSGAIREQLGAIRTTLAAGLGAQEEQNARLAALEADAAEKAALAQKECARADALAERCAALESELAKAREIQAASEAALRESVRQETAGALQADFEAEREKLLGQTRAQEADLAKMRDDLARLRAELEHAVDANALEQMKSEAADDHERLESRVRQLERERDGARESLAAGLNAKAAQELRAQLSKEQERANSLEQRLRDETARGTKSLLAEQLADALRENDALREELRRMEGAAAGAREEAAAQGSQRTADAEEAMLRRVAGSLRNGHKRTLGEILIEADIITPEQLDEALDEQRRNPHTHLGAILNQKGFATSEAVAQALAMQCNVGFVRLVDTFVEPDATKLISGRLAAQHRCIPLRTVDNEGLIIAIANPLDLVAIEDIERSTGRRVEVMVATEREIRNAVEQHYAAE